MTKPMYKAKTTGIKKWAVDAIAVKENTWELYVKLFGLISKGSKLMQYPIVGSLYKRLLFFDPPEKKYTHGTVLNLNVDISDSQEQCVLPVDLIKDILKKTKLIASTKSCICRESAKCTKYPSDLSCLFFGSLAEAVIKNGIAYEISYEKALDRVEQAAKYGLVGQGLWVEVEQYLWGAHDMDSFLQICFCSPDTCLAMKSVRYGPRDVKERFTSSGWQATVNDNCKKCGACIPVCPQRAIAMGREKIEINEDYCFGCGVCKTKCNNGAIKIELVKPMKESILDYFKEDGKLPLHFD